MTRNQYVVIEKTRKADGKISLDWTFKCSDFEMCKEYAWESYQFLNDAKKKFTQICVYNMDDHFMDEPLYIAGGEDA